MILHKPAVASLADFKAKYGNGGEELQNLVRRFVREAPAFEGERELAIQLGIAMADLESMLRYTAP